MPRAHAHPPAETHTHTHTHTHMTRTHARTHARTYARAHTHTPKCNDRQKHTWCALCAWRALLEAAAANILLSASKELPEGRCRRLVLVQARSGLLKYSHAAKLHFRGRAGGITNFLYVHQTGGPAASARAPFFRARARLLLVSEYSQASDGWIRSATD